MESTKKITTASIALVLFVILIAAVKTVDVEPIGPEGTAIGLSKINGAAHGFLGESMLWYEITEVLGYVAIAICALFALGGLIQLITRKSIAKVDREVFALAGLYVVMAAFYALFEKVVINYRPVIMPDETGPEASFPSSHTMLACVVFGSTIVMLGIYMEAEKKRLIMQIVLEILIFITVFGRLLSGVHWLTDIVGGVLLSIFLVSAFDAVISKFEEE